MWKRRASGSAYRRRAGSWRSQVEGLENRALLSVTEYPVAEIGATNSAPND
jgi:hypothetical protein